MFYEEGFSMKMIGKGSFLGGPLGALAGGVLGLGMKAFGVGKKKKAPIQPLPQVSRDDAAARMADDELLRRRGGAADMITGTTGAEAALSGGKLVLGS
jgi:hypothetical protein